MTVTIALSSFNNKHTDEVRALYAASVALNKQGFIQDLSYHGDIAAFGLEQQKRGGDLLVAEHDGKVIGMGALRPEEDGAVELCKLHLMNTLQGMGLGRKIGAALIERAKELGFKRVTLHVTTSQTAAIGLYKSAGFVEDKREVWTGDINGQLESYETLFMHKDL